MAEKPDPPAPGYPGHPEIPCGVTIPDPPAELTAGMTAQQLLNLQAYAQAVAQANAHHAPENNS